MNVVEFARRSWLELWLLVGGIGGAWVAATRPDFVLGMASAAVIVQSLLLMQMREQTRATSR